MNTDEREIRNVISEWARLSEEGDTEGVLSLMTEDVVFLLAGQPPIRGRAGFAALKGDPGSAPKDFRVEPEIMEVIVHGDWAHCWTRLRVSMTPPAGGAPVHRSGHTLTLFRKDPDGKWRLARDANLLTAEK